MQRFYRCDRESAVGKRLKNFHHAAIRAANKAEDYAKMFGASAYIQPVEYFEGGVDFLEFDKEPDPEVWRKRTDLGDVPYYEPRCDCKMEWYLTKDKSHKPADTWNMIYKGDFRKWEEVRHTMPDEYWAEKTGYKMSGDEAKDKALLRLRLSLKLSGWWCLSYLEFSGDQAKTKGKTPKALHRAIAAERMRMKLPVLRVDTLLEILGFKWPEDTKERKTISRKMETPTFFVLGSKYYISIQGECRAENLEEIDNTTYTIAKREIEKLQQ